MNWVRIDDSLWTNEELASCSVEARVLFYAAWSYCGQTKTDGKLSTLDVRAIATAQGINETAPEEIVGAGLWTREEDGFSIPTWQGGGGYSIPLLRREWMRLRRRLAPLIYKRDGRECSKCGSGVDLTIDHIVPIARGGKNDPENLQPMCRRCNSGKGAR